MSPSVLEAACAFAPTLRPLSEVIEKDRRIPPEVVLGLARAGCFRMLVPRALGGEETPPEVMVRVIEEVTRADAAAGWCVMVGATSGMMAAFLEPEAARLIYGSDPLVVTSGVFAPMGRAMSEGDSYRVSGRWPFASGSEHCAWRMGGAIVMDGDKPRLLPGGAPEVQHIVFRAEETQIIDTWSVSGLCGTGSHDMVVESAIVPKARSASLISDRPRHDGALYRFPMFGLLSLGISAVALGIAREAIEALKDLAGAKRPMGGKRTLAQRELVQLQVGQAEGLVRSARAFVFDAIGEAQAAADRGDLGTDHRALLRLAASHATSCSAQAVDLMYRAGGGTSIYKKCPLQRHFRDVHVATQHAMVSEATFALSGRVLLGLETDTAML